MSATALLATQGIEPPLPPLTHWQPFATALAAASATLMGLLFVALSLNTHILTETHYGAQRRLARLAFGAFAQLLLIALLLLIPHPTVRLLALALGISALVGLTQAARIGVLEWRRDPDADASARTRGELGHL
jgi:peptidoglycan/LPS O-acetylase OafA/YrhL